MCNGTKRKTQRAGANGARWRRFVDQLGVFGLQLSELANEHVVFTVGDLRRVVRVIALVVVRNLLAQFGEAFRGRHHAHAPSTHRVAVD